MLLQDGWDVARLAKYFAVTALVLCLLGLAIALASKVSLVHPFASPSIVKLQLHQGKWCVHPREGPGLQKPLSRQSAYDGCRAGACLSCCLAAPLAFHRSG